MLTMPIKDNLVYATYYAPRGRKRMYTLASVLSMRYLYTTDLLIGVIGGDGSGKSTLIKGLFPGLELTNDDEGVNVSPAPIFEFSEPSTWTSDTNPPSTNCLKSSRRSKPQSMRTAGLWWSILISFISNWVSMPR